MEVILLPHVTMVVSKQHQYVTERRNCYRARGRGRRDIGFAQGWPCVLVTVAVMSAAVTVTGYCAVQHPQIILLCKI